MEHFTKSVAFCLVLHGASALATEGPILDRLMGVIPPGEYVGLNDSGHCSLKVTNQELNGVNVEIFEEGALREDGSIDPTKWLAFPFAETDEVAVHSESFGAGEAFLEYTYNPADQVSGPLTWTRIGFL